MTKIFVWSQETFDCNDSLEFVGFAITEHGKFIAGALSALDEDTVELRTSQMARRKAPEMITGDVEIFIVADNDEQMLKAKKLAFERLP